MTLIHWLQNFWEEDFPQREDRGVKSITNDEGFLEMEKAFSSLP